MRPNEWTYQSEQTDKCPLFDLQSIHIWKSHSMAKQRRGKARSIWKRTMWNWSSLQPGTAGKPLIDKQLIVLTIHEYRFSFTEFTPISRICITAIAHSPTLPTHSSTRTGKRFSPNWKVPFSKHSHWSHKHYWIMCSGRCLIESYLCHR